MPPSEGRGLDRRLTVAGIGVAALFLVAAGGSLLLPDAERRGLWLPLHLAFLGGAGVAIAAVLPFFAASLSAVPPAPPGRRTAAIFLLALGAGAVTGGVVAARPDVALGGGILVLAGLGATAATLVVVLRATPAGRSSERARVARAATFAGLGALGSLAVGGLLAILFLAGTPPVAANWATIRAAHAWLNLFGFVGLVVTSTLVHLLPTALGTRVVAGPTGFGAVVLLGTGSGLGAVGFLAGSDGLARLGAAALLGSAGLLGLEAARMWRRRGRWTTDLGWHRFVVGSLLGGVVWFGVAVAIVAVRTLVAGASPGAWDLRPVVVPLCGWLAAVLLGSASHLVPAIGPGDPGSHAALRRRLGRAAALRLVALHGGVLLAFLAEFGDVSGAAGPGSASLPALGFVGLVGQLAWLASAGASTALLGWAVLSVLRRR